MDKKAYLLSTLKRQVMALKTQLQNIESVKSHHRSKWSQHQQSHQRSPHSNHRSTSHSSRFQSNAAEFDRGIKMCKTPEKEYRNIQQMIHDKSRVERMPHFSSQRRA